MTQPPVTSARRDMTNNKTEQNVSNIATMSTAKPETVTSALQKNAKVASMDST